MLAAVFKGDKIVDIDNVNISEPAENEVLIRVAYCGVCGTDIHIYNGEAGAADVTPPLILGHEFSGIVERVGSGVKGINVDDRVAVDPNDMCGACYYCKNGKNHFCDNFTGIGTTVNGGFAQYVTVRAKQVYKLPDNISLKESVFTEPISCCINGIDLLDIKTGNTVLVIGGGPIGLIMMQLSRISGASQIILVEPELSKRKIAKKLGADIVIDPNSQSISEVIINQHIDRTIECVGLKSTMEDTVKHTSKGGNIMLFGLTEPNCKIEIRPYDIFKKELTIRSSFINPYTFSRAINILASKKLNVNDIISSIIELKDINNVFLDSTLRKKGKCIIKCN